MVPRLPALILITRPVVIREFVTVIGNCTQQSTVFTFVFDYVDLDIFLSD